MTDFSELCPIFNTGVFNEVVFPNVAMTDVSACANALFATYDAMASALGSWSFGRTVIVTAAWLKKAQDVEDEEIIYLKHFSSKNATGTNFGTLTVDATVTGMPVGHAYVPMNISTAMTFTSAAVLGLCPATVTAGSGGVFDLVVRYKEK